MSQPPPRSLESGDVESTVGEMPSSLAERDLDERDLAERDLDEGALVESPLAESGSALVESEPVPPEPVVESTRVEPPPVSMPSLPPPPPRVDASDPMSAPLAAAVANPSDDGAWDTLEASAANTQKPEVVVEAYVYALASGATTADPAFANQLGQRAVRFHDEWFAEPDRLLAILRRVLAVDADAHWAFERIVMVLTVASRWDDLLDAYDRVLAKSADKTRKAQLLDEAAHVAKDFSGQPDRAIQYLLKLQPLRPADAQLATSLERLLERQGRHRDLVELWTARLSVLSRDGKLATRARIAACWLDRLNEPDAALGVCETLLTEDPHDTSGCKILERIATLDKAQAPTRRRALKLLEQRYSNTKRSADVVRVLEISLREAEPQDRAAIHREIIDRSLDLGRADGAMDHCAALVLLEPGSDDARTRLRTIADKTNKQEQRAQALEAAVAAASGDPEKVSLLVEAAQVRSEILQDDARAAELFGRALGSKACAGEVRLDVARRQEAILDRLGRADDRLVVLEELADLEPDAGAKRDVLARAAAVAASRGDVDRALLAWERRIDADANDTEALDAIAELLQRASRWTDLVAALQRRIEATQDEGRRRADLVRIASLQERELAAVTEAIATFRTIDEQFGPTAETVDALARLLAADQKFDDLAAHLEGAARREDDLRRRADLLHQLGDVHREKLTALDRAASWYRDALAAEPTHAGARAGLRAILERADDDTVRAAAANTLAEAYRKTDDWASLLEIVEHRVAVASDPTTKAAVLTEASRLHEERAGDAQAALSAVARALPLTPSDASLELDLLRLADSTSSWAAAIDALAATISASAADPLRSAALRVQMGMLLELRTNDLPRALDAYLPVLAVFPESAEATDAVIRVAGRTGRWEDASRAFVDYSRAHHRIDPDIVGSFEGVADEQNAWDLATTAIESAVSRADLAPALARDVETVIGLWHRDRREDLDRAEKALARAVSRDGTDAEVLRLLAVLQRRHPDVALLDTLLLLADVTSEDLGVLYEAAQVALDVVSDRDRSAQILGRLLDASAKRWERTPHSLPTLPPASAPVRPSMVPAADPVRDLSADSFAAWALDRLVVLHADGGDHRAAVDVLVRGAKMPFDRDTARGHLHRAAELAAGIPDPDRAVALYREIVADAPSDERALSALAKLYESGALYAELSELRRHELRLAPTIEARLALRLDLARVLGLRSELEEQLDALRANLEEQPGHPQTVDAATLVLDVTSRHTELAHLLSEQALLLEATGDGPQAAALWAKVAVIAESKLADVPRALASWGRVVALEPTAEAYDALARLHASRRESAAAIEWLERRLAATPEGQRADTVRRLAERHLEAGDRTRARDALEGGLAQEPGARPLREMLADMQRETGAFGDVARLLKEGAAHETDLSTRVEWLREAAELHVRDLQDPGGAVPLYEEAANIAEQLGNVSAPGGPKDRVRALRVALADALRRADRHDEAKALCEQLVEWYGRRRPPERAQVHVQLAHLAKARGEISEALSQLELASTMDMGSASILRMLGSLAREGGDFGRAERAYRALLLIVRRPGVVLDTTIGPSEVLFELHRIATSQNQEDRARENLESAFEAASQNEAEGRRFVQLLRDTGNEAFLVRALQARVAAEQDPQAAAATLIELADVLDGIGRVDEALDARLEALGHQPESISLHVAVRDVARRADKLVRYEERLRALAARALQAGDAVEAASFFLRLGELLEQDAGDLVRAAEAYGQAEATGEQLAAACRALARVARTRTDRDAELRALRQLVQVDDQDPGLRTEALFRLAELDLERPESREEGAEMLAWAIDRDPQLERALGLLRSVPASENGVDERVAALHERVARASGDATLLLEALERLAATASPSFELLREGAELAQKAGDGARTEGFLRRAIALGRAQDLVAEVSWALVALAERRKADLPREAIALLQEAAEVAEGSDAFDLQRDAATLAATTGDDLKLASSIYEKLLQRDAGDRRVWEPLLEVYRKLGDRKQLEKLIADTIDNVFDAGERNVLRLERARLLLESKGREEDAAIALREILDDEPDQEGAATALLDLYEKTGRTDDLVSLLRDRLALARDRNVADVIAVLSLRLGGVLEKTSREDAIEVYRDASEQVPGHRGLLHAQVRLLKANDPPDVRATAMERLLAVETGEAAAALALELASVRQTMGDEDGVARALDRAFTENPGAEKVRMRLEKVLQARSDWKRLAEIFVIDARQRRDKRSAVARFREAAKLHQEKLGDPTTAVSVLREARELLPDDVALAIDLASARGGAGENVEAIRDLELLLETGKLADPMRVSILRVRSELRMGSGDDAGAVEDLEAAFAIGGVPLAAELCAALDRRRAKAAKRRDVEVEKNVTRRLVEVLSATGDRPRARETLVAWLTREPKDVEAWRTLAAIDTANEDWSAVVDGYRHLVDLETGEAQADAALLLADAADHVGRGEEARVALEKALEQNGGDQRLRDRLRRTYESIGAYSELAQLAMLDAQHAPDDPSKFDLLLAAGDLFIRAPGEESRAIEPLGMALQLKPFHHEATLLLADALTLSGEIDRAMEVLNPAIDKHKGRRSKEVAALQHRMARAANAGGGRDVELQWLTKALECDMQNGQVAAELAEVAIELRQFEIALKALKAVTLLRTPGPMSRALATLRQGQIAFQQGDPKRAILLAKKALAEEPSLGEAEDFLREIGA